MMYKYTNKKIFFNKYIFIIVSFVIPSFVFANVSIIEIMYDPKDTDASAGGEWIEIYNNGSAPLDLTTWLFFEANTNHGITADGISLVPPGGYAVISRDLTAFKNFFTEFSGLLFKASFSLNDGEKLAVKSDKEAIPSDEVTYTTEWGAKNDGNSLQKINGIWAAAAPTPGTYSASGSPETGGSGSGSEESSSGATAEQSSGSSAVIQTIWADAGSDKTAIVGAGTIFEGKALGIDKKPLDGARYLWNFGNGFTGEGKKVMHTYKHPGDYIVYLDVSSGSVSAGDKILVKATPADVSISALGYGEKSFVAVSNSEPTELDVSFWQIKSNSGVFVIPKNTIIIPNNKIIFSKDALGFEINEGDEVALIYPNGSLAYKFTNSAPSVLVANQVAYSVNGEKPAVVSSSYNNNESEDNQISADEEKSNSELTASVADSLPDNGNSSGMSKWLLGAFAVMAVSVIGVLAIRNYGRRNDDSQEIKILE